MRDADKVKGLAALALVLHAEEGLPLREAGRRRRVAGERVEFGEGGGVPGGHDVLWEARVHARGFECETDDASFF